MGQNLSFFQPQNERRYRPPLDAVNNMLTSRSEKALTHQGFKGEIDGYGPWSKIDKATKRQSTTSSIREYIKYERGELRKVSGKP